MPKFSIIVPVYNVEKYIGKCLDSIMNQTFKDFEFLILEPFRLCAEWLLCGIIDFVNNIKVRR